MPAPTNIVSLLLTYLLVGLAVMAFALPELWGIMAVDKEITVAEESCAWIGANYYVYENKIERKIIRSHITKRSEKYGRNHYDVIPVTFFALPWKKATVECLYSKEQNRLVPVNGFLTNQTLETTGY